MASARLRIVRAEQGPAGQIDVYFCDDKTEALTPKDVLGVGRGYFHFRSRSIMRWFVLSLALLAAAPASPPIRQFGMAAQSTSAG